MYILFSLTRFPLLSARVDELDFCFFSTQAQRFLSKIMYMLFSLTRFPLLSARVDELDFCFFDAGTEIFVEDHVHFIFSNALSLAVSQGRRIRFLFFSTQAQRFLSKIMYMLFSLTRFPLLSARVDELYFCFFRRRHRDFCRRSCTFYFL